ncbi:hypothetical protein MRX96_024257 [Rhipicephalus microplus]
MQEMTSATGFFPKRPSKNANSMQLGNFVAYSHYMNLMKQWFSIVMCHATSESQATPKNFQKQLAPFGKSAVQDGNPHSGLA